MYRLTLNGWPDRIQEGTLGWVNHQNQNTVEGRQSMYTSWAIWENAQHLHDNHRGIEKMKHLSQTTAYWPRIDADITDYVNHCKTCTQHKAKQAVQPMLPRDVWDSLWQDLAANFFTYNHKEYFLLTDTFSKYAFIYQTSSKSAKSIIKKITKYNFPIWPSKQVLFR